MIIKFIKRCLLACAVLTTFVIGTLAVCGALACSSPGFYAAALSAPVDPADEEAAVKELESIANSIGMFAKLDATDFQTLRAMPEQTIAALDRGDGHKDDAATKALRMLHRSPDVTQDTISVSLTQRQLNAWLNQELGAGDDELPRPHIAIQEGMIRFAMTLATPATEVVVSCDFELAKTNQTDLTLELHALRIGRLPAPAMAILKQYMRFEPELPTGLTLNLEGERPALSIDFSPHDAQLLLQDLSVTDGKLHLTLRRKQGAKVAAN